MKQNVNGIAVVLQKFKAELAKLTEFSRRDSWRSAANPARSRSLWRSDQGRQRDVGPILLRSRGQSRAQADQRGNLRERVDIDCKGDHQRMKEAINGVHSWLRDLVSYVKAMANAI